MSERTKNLPRRSCHATPGSNEKMLGKAPGLGADQVFLDLEDSVSPLEKEAARGKVVNAIKNQDWGETVVCVRVNAWDTEWTYRDVVTVVENAGERLDEIMLPKVENAAQVVALDLLLTQIEKVTGRQSRVGIEAQIETAQGLINVEEICAASDRLETIIFGPADFAASTEMPVLTGGVQIPEYPGDHFHYVFSKILMAGRANGLQVIDGPFLKIRELDALRDYAMRTRILGYDGKWSLHPDQVTVINEVYTPTQEQFDKAFDILEAYEKATTEGERRGAVMFGDEMIDEASRKMANKFVSRGERAGMTRSAADRSPVNAPAGSRRERCRDRRLHVAWGRGSSFPFATTTISPTRWSATRSCRHRRLLRVAGCSRPAARWRVPRRTPLRRLAVVGTRRPRDPGRSASRAHRRARPGSSSARFRRNDRGVRAAVRRWPPAPHVTPAADARSLSAHDATLGDRDRCRRDRRGGRVAARPPGRPRHRARAVRGRPHAREQPRVVPHLPPRLPGHVLGPALP